MVDLLTHQYRTKCVFNRDGTVSTVRWIVMPDDAPCLEDTSAVCNLDYELDKELYQDPLGEVWGEPRPEDLRVIPAVLLQMLRGHVCGTPEDFERGGVYDPAKGETRYGALGFPLCCWPPKKLAGGPGGGGHVRLIPDFTDATAGGVEVGGQVGDQYGPRDPTAGGVAVGGSAGDVYTPPDPTAGGVAVGGSAGDVYTPPDPTAGGVAVGGSAGDVWTPGGSDPGPTCDTALSMTLGTEYTATQSTTAQQWWKFPVVSGTTYRIVCSLWGTMSAPMVQQGTSCSALGLPFFHNSGPSCQSYDPSVTGFIYLTFFPPISSPVSYTVKAEAGACS